MVYDQAQSPRLGQPTAVESTTVRFFTGSSIPEASWHGQLIYREDTQELQVYDASVDAWKDAVGGQIGQLTFVGPRTIGPPDKGPVANNTGDLWFDTHPGNIALGIPAGQRKMYRAEAPEAELITAEGDGGWVLMADDRIIEVQIGVEENRLDIVDIKEVVEPTAPPAYVPIISDVASGVKALNVIVEDAPMLSDSLFVQAATDVDFNVVIAEAEASSTSLHLAVPGSTMIWVRAWYRNVKGDGPVSDVAGPFTSYKIDSVDIKDFALDAKKLYSTRHALY